MFVRSVLCLSVLCLCVLSVYHAAGQTQDVDPMPGYSWPTVYDAEPTLAQYWVTVSCLKPRRMLASVIEGGPTLTQLLFKASCQYYSQHEVGLLTPVEWILASTGEAGPTFNRHWVGVGMYSPPAVSTNLLSTTKPANTRRWTSACLMLGQHRRWWASIVPALRKRLVLAGSVYKPHCVWHIGVVPKRNNKFCLIHSPQESFTNIIYKSHWHYIY